MLIDPIKTYTYKDYILCDENEKIEIIDEKVYNMSLAPSRIHQNLVSPYNPNNDFIRKLNLYDKFKVKEYWIVNPMKKNILIYSLDANECYGVPDIYTFEDKIKVGIYSDLEIDFNSFNLQV